MVCGRVFPPGVAYILTMIYWDQIIFTQQIQYPAVRFLQTNSLTAPMVKQVFVTNFAKFSQIVAQSKYAKYLLLSDTYITFNGFCNKSFDGCACVIFTHRRIGSTI